jgi:hypothetical protein
MQTVLAKIVADKAIWVEARKAAAACQFSE